MQDICGGKQMLDYISGKPCQAQQVAEQLISTVACQRLVCPDLQPAGRPMQGKPGSSGYSPRPS